MVGEAIALGILFLRMNMNFLSARHEHAAMVRVKMRIFRRRHFDIVCGKIKSPFHMKGALLQRLTSFDNVSLLLHQAFTLWLKATAGWAIDAALAASINDGW